MSLMGPALRTHVWLCFIGLVCGLGCTLGANGEGMPDSVAAAGAGAGGSEPAEGGEDPVDASGGSAGDLGPPDTGVDAPDDFAIDEGAVEACVPVTCSELNASCGDAKNGCGGMIQCGACGLGYGCHANACAAVVYVAANAKPGGKGTSWADALQTIHEALASNPPAGTEVWVAKGTYTRAGSASVVVAMIPGVPLYGHFAGTEQALEERNLASADNTVLEGQGARVVQAAGSTVLDGFTVQNGVAAEGAGIYALNVQDFRVRNCVIATNSSGGNGAGIFVQGGSNITIANTEVRGNKSGSGGIQGPNGGGLYLASSSTTIDHCTIKGNTSGNGGGLAVQGGKVEVTSTWFEGNNGFASGQAGTGAAHNASLDSGSYTNCVFVHNASAGYGGAIYNAGASPRIVNCTFWGNTAALQKGLDVFDNPGSPVIVNSILASGTTGQYSVSDHPDPGVKTAQVSYSDVVGEPLGGTNIDADPAFKGAAQGDFSLNLGSKCIDTGDPTAAPSNDYTGYTRDSKPDMGAFEYHNP